MNEAEDFTPSLVAGLVRYRTKVIVAVVAFALVGAVYALVTWKPQATMSVVVQVSSGVSGQNNIDPDRATSEVAAQLGSPQVRDAAAESSGVAIDKVTATSSQGQSTIAVVVEAGSDSAAAAGANALLPAYDQVRIGQNQQQIEAQLAVIDASIADVDNSINLTNTQLAGVAAASNEAANLRNELDTLTARRNQLRADRDTAQIAASSPAVNVAIGDGPNPGPGRISLLMRYVPAGIVLGLIVSLAVIAIVERRRPWLSRPEDAGRLLGAPVVAVGQGSGADGHIVDDVAPVVAMALLRAIGDANPGIALVLPRGPVDLGQAVQLLADRMEPVLDRAGAAVTTLFVSDTGRTFRIDQGQIGAEVAGLWNELGSRDQFEKALELAGLGSDTVVLVPVVDIEHEVLLDLVLLSDACVVATSMGTELAPLLALRRDFDALGRRPDGVVLDPSLPTVAS